MLDLLRATEATEAISRAPFVADRLSRTLFYNWGQFIIGANIVSGANIRTNYSLASLLLNSPTYM